MAMAMAMATRSLEVKVPVFSKSALKSSLLEVLREVERTGEAAVITDHRRPVLRIVPYEGEKSVDELFADLRLTARLPPDDELNAPLEEEWAEFQ